MSDIFEKVQQTITEVAADTPGNAKLLEAFRIRYLGTKGEIKALMEEMRAVPNERKREFGQLMNTLKLQAEEKYAALKSDLEAQAESAVGQQLDLTAPGEPLPIGSRHPVAVTMNRIVDIFARMGFAVVDGPEIEDDWHNFTAMNTPEDHPARDMQDTFYVVDAPGMLLRTPYVTSASTGDGKPAAAHSDHCAGSGLSQRDYFYALARAVSPSGRLVCG